MRIASIASLLALAGATACVRPVGGKGGSDGGGEASRGSRESPGASLAASASTGTPAGRPGGIAPGDDGALGLADPINNETRGTAAGSSDGVAEGTPGVFAGTSANSVPGVPSSGDAAARFGCTGSAAVAFEESYTAQGGALAASLASLEARQAHERDAWRVSRLAIVRALGSGADTSLAALAVPFGSGASDESGEGNDDGTPAGNDASSVAARGGPAAANDATASCKRLGALVASLRTSARTLEAKGAALCGTLAPARAGALAAQVACRLETRAGRAVAFVSFAATLPHLAPACGAGYARACQAVFRARLGEGGARSGCKDLASDASGIDALAKWACREP